MARLARQGRKLWMYIVLAVGVKYSENSTASYSIPKHDKVIHVDANPNNIGRVVPACVGVNADARVFFDRLIGDAAIDPHFTAERKSVIDKRIGASRDPKKRDGIRNQDIAIWEGQQIARGSPAADDLKFAATWETNVHHFQTSLLDVMQRGA